MTDASTTPTPTQGTTTAMNIDSAKEIEFVKNEINKIYHGEQGQETTDTGPALIMNQIVEIYKCREEEDNLAQRLAFEKLLNIISLFHKKKLYGSKLTKFYFEKIGTVKTLLEGVPDFVRYCEQISHVLMKEEETIFLSERVIKACIDLDVQKTTERAIIVKPEWKDYYNLANSIRTWQARNAGDRNAVVSRRLLKKLLEKTLYGLTCFHSNKSNTLTRTLFLADCLTGDTKCKQLLDQFIYTYNTEKMWDAEKFVMDNTQTIKFEQVKADYTSESKYKKMKAVFYISLFILSITTLEDKYLLDLDEVDDNDNNNAAVDRMSDAMARRWNLGYQEV